MASILVPMLLSSLIITSVSGPYSSFSEYSEVSSSRISSDFSIHFSGSILEKRIPTNIPYHDRSSVWAKSLYTDYEPKNPLSPKANACSKSYSLPFNTTIRLQAVSNSDCTININTSLNSATWLVIEIRRRDGNPNHSTFSFKTFLKRDQKMKQILYLFRSTTANSNFLPNL